MMRTREEVLEVLGEQRSKLEESIENFVEQNKMQFFSTGDLMSAMDGLSRDQRNVEILESASCMLIADAEIMESIRRVLSGWYDQQQNYVSPNLNKPGAVDRGLTIAVCIDQLTKAVSEAGQSIDIADSGEAFVGWTDNPDGDGDYVRTTGPHEKTEYQFETVAGGFVVTGHNSGIRTFSSFGDEIRWLKLPPCSQRANRYPMQPLDESQAMQDLERERRKLMRIDSEVSGWKSLSRPKLEKLLDRILEITRSHDAYGG